VGSADGGGTRAGQSRSPRSTRGSSPTAGCGPAASTPWSNTSTRGRRPPMPTTDHVADGALETREGEHVLRFERRFDHPIERVWAALTEPEELVAWLADADVDLVKGGRIELRWLNTDDQGNIAVLHGTLPALEPLRVIEYLRDI